MKRLPRVAVTALVAACGGGSATTTSAPVLAQRTPSGVDLAATTTKLPTSVIGIAAVPTSTVVADGKLVLFGKELAAADPCSATVAASIDGVFEPVIEYDPDLSFPGTLIHTPTPLDAVARCASKLEGSEVETLGDMRAINLNVFATLGDGWVVHSMHGFTQQSVDDITRVRAKATGRPNPLGEVLAHKPAGALWTAMAVDYTWELLGVHSIGALFEYDRRDEAGPFTMRVLFADAASAKLARERLDHPDKAVLQSAFGESAEGAIKIILAAAVTVDGTEVIVRGQIQKDWWDGVPFNFFRALGVPRGRPLTAEEQQHQLRAPTGRPRW